MSSYELVTVSEMARIMGVCPRTINVYRQQGLIPSVREPGPRAPVGWHRYAPAVVKAIIEGWDHQPVKPRKPRASD